ncbi:MAG: hypothetical protein KDE27_23410 [Planctomycetes bacterium]|nr:hypothetical protein [Planctomycetota bacterium]
MPARAATLLALAALALAAVALTFALAASRGDPAPPPAAPPPADSTDSGDASALDRRLTALERQLAALDRYVRGLGTASSADDPDRVAAPPPAADAPDTAARLAAVEATVAAMRSELSALGPMPETLTGIVKALADKNLQGYGVTAEQRQRRRELWRKFLELAPDDPGAVDVFTKLFNDYLGSDSRQSLALLDEWETKLQLPAHDAAMLRANGLLQSGQSDAAREIYAAMRDDGRNSEAERVAAHFWHAHSWKRQGRYDEARREFEILIARYAGREPEPAIASLVRGARAQIEEMDRWAKQAAEQKR